MSDSEGQLLWTLTEERKPKTCADKMKTCCGVFCLILLIILLGYAIFLAIVFRGIPYAQLVSLTPNCKSSAECLAFGASGIPFTAKFDIRNANNIGMDVSMNVRLFKPNGVDEVGSGFIIWQRVASSTDLSSGSKSNANGDGTSHNMVDTTVNFNVGAMSKPILDFFFQNGNYVYSKPRVDSSPAVTYAEDSSSSSSTAQPLVYNLVLLTTITPAYYGWGFWIPTQSMEQDIMVGDPIQAISALTGKKSSSNMLTKQDPNMDPNFVNRSPVAPNNIDSTLPWSATGVYTAALPVAPLSAVLGAGNIRVGFSSNYGFLQQPHDTDGVKSHSARESSSREAAKRERSSFALRQKIRRGNLSPEDFDPN